MFNISNIRTLIKLNYVRKQGKIREGLGNTKKIIIKPIKEYNKIGKYKIKKEYFSGI